MHWVGRSSELLKNRRYEGKFVVSQTPLSKTGGRSENSTLSRQSFWMVIYLCRKVEPRKLCSEQTVLRLHNHFLRLQINFTIKPWWQWPIRTSIKENRLCPRHLYVEIVVNKNHPFYLNFRWKVLFLLNLPTKTKTANSKRVEGLC